MYTHAAWERHRYGLRPTPTTTPKIVLRMYSRPHYRGITLPRKPLSCIFAHIGKNSRCSQKRIFNY